MCAGLYGHPVYDFMHHWAPHPIFLLAVYLKTRFWNIFISLPLPDSCMSTSECGYRWGAVSVVHSSLCLSTI